MNAFHAYDIRGIYNKDFNKDDVYKVGYFLPKVLKTSKVLVGRDVRVSSPEIFEYLCNGIIDSGADVYDIGLATTPLVYYTTANKGFDASVMITASHNDKEYNGLKVSTTNAAPVGFDTGLNEIEQLMKSEIITVAKEKGQIIKLEVEEDYLKFLKGFLPDLSKLNISIDCSNGMAALLVKKLLGDAPSYIYDELDGTFPNHSPNPLKEENLTGLKKEVIKNKGDLGIIFDGDADRVMFVDENGKFIQPDLMIAVMADYYLNKPGNKKQKVIHDIRTSKSVIEHVKRLGGEPYMWKVGRAYAALKLKEIDGVFGGELAGHYYFKDFFFSDSALLATLIVLDIVNKLKEKGVSLSEKIKEIANYSNSGELNFVVEQKKEAMNALKDYFSDKEEVTAFYDFDGYRVEFKDWWFNVRPSNTEPYLRLLIEAKNALLLEEKTLEINKILNNYITE